MAIAEVGMNIFSTLTAL